MTTRINLKINQGATFKHSIIWLDSNQIPIDVTGMTALMHIRSRIDSATPLLVLSSNVLDNPDGLITMYGTTGEIFLYIPHTKTSLAAWDYAVYDLEVTDSVGDVTRVIEGNVTVSKEVTR